MNKLLTFCITLCALLPALKADIVNEHIDNYFDILIYEPRDLFGNGSQVFGDSYTFLSNLDYDDGLSEVDALTPDATDKDNDMVRLFLVRNPDVYGYDVDTLKIKVSDKSHIKLYDKSKKELDIVFDSNNTAVINLLDEEGPLYEFLTTGSVLIYVDSDTLSTVTRTFEFVITGAPPWLPDGPQWHAFKRVVLVFKSQMDSDGLDDFWEWDYFGSFSYTGTDDPDEDGRINSDEEFSGTNPLIPDAMPTVYSNSISYVE